MNPKFIKISILLPLFLFFGFFIGCDNESVDIKYLYEVNDIKIEGNQDSNNTLSVKLSVFSNIIGTKHVSNKRHYSSNCLYAVGVHPVGDELGENKKIISCNIKTVFNNISLNNFLKDNSNHSVEDFRTNINKNVSPINNAGSAKQAIEESSFLLVETPKELKGKDSKIVFLITTKEGQIFSDTTKIISFK